MVAPSQGEDAWHVVQLHGCVVRFGDGDLMCLSETQFSAKTTNSFYPTCGLNLKLENTGMGEEEGGN